jgi:uncharacterized protein
MAATFASRWNVLGAALIALGMLGAGWLIGDGFARGRAGEHYVTVKGLAETFVEADLAIWPLRYTATGDDLNQVQAKIDADGAEITAFLTREGIAPEAIAPQRVEVTDLLAQAYRPEGAASNRFIIAQTILVRTDQVDLVATLNRTTGELVSRGVVLVDTGGTDLRVHRSERDQAADAGRGERQRTRGRRAVRRRRRQHAWRHPPRLAGHLRDPAA